MKVLKGIIVWFGMMFMAITSAIWGLFGYEVSIEANRRGR